MHYTTIAALSLVAAASARSIIPRQQQQAANETTMVFLGDCTMQTQQQTTMKGSGGSFFADFTGDASGTPDGQGGITDLEVDTLNDWDNGKPFSIDFENTEGDQVAKFDAGLNEKADSDTAEGDLAGTGTITMGDGSTKEIECFKAPEGKFEVGELTCDSKFMCQQAGFSEISGQGAQKQQQQQQQGGKH